MKGYLYQCIKRWFRYALMQIKRTYHIIQLENDQVKIYFYDKEKERRTEKELKGLFMPIQTVSKLVQIYKNDDDNEEKVKIAKEQKKTQKEEMVRICSPKKFDK